MNTDHPPLPKLRLTLPPEAPPESTPEVPPEVGNPTRKRPGAEAASAPGRPFVGLYDAHCHTILCGHARGELEQYAAFGLRRGLAGMTVTCHNPLPDGYAAHVRMAEHQLDDYVRQVQRTAHLFETRLDVRLGLEADYVPGYEKYVEKQLQQHPFDFVLGSVHPQFAQYKARYFRGDVQAYQKLYFEHLAASAETRLFDSLAHPDLIKHLAPKHWSIGRIIDDACRALDRIAKTGVAMEFNTSGWRKPMGEPSPCPRLLYEMARRRIPVTLGSDAHSPQRVGENFGPALRLLSAAGYRTVAVYHQRKRIDVSLAAAFHSLKPLSPVTSVQQAG